jgi:CheY-like chemotaxis protein/nitrogen-specific signal transduction histidine kinase/PAS domain-containing protein
MLIAPLPKDEAQRLEALHAYHAFRTGPEPGFDRITSLVARTLRIPSAYVSLVGEDTQWLKSCFNLEGPRETSRDIAFCAHAILSNDVFVVPDATLDPRFSDSPLVTGAPYVRFYAGCPLRTPSGYSVGTLCAVDSEARVPTLEMLETLKDLASLVVDQLELRKWMLGEEARQRHEAEVNYRRLAEAIHGMVFRAKYAPNGEYEYLYVSPGSAQLLGVEADAFADDPFAFVDRIHLDDLHSYRATIAEALTRKKSWNWAGRVTTTHGVSKWVQGDGRCETMDDGSSILEGLFFDISDLKGRESALNTAKEAAESASRAKSEFLSRMSHEFRTPMNAILGFAQMLELEPLGVEAREDLSQVQKAGDHLLGLINEVLDLSSVDENRLSLSLEPVRLDDLISETVGLLRPLFEASGIRLSGLLSTLKVSVLADRRRLKQVVINLMTNAVKYNRLGGLVSIEVSRRADGIVSLGITDEGQGIPAEKLERLYTPFDRLGAEATGIEGTGLGLAIAHGLVLAMGGQLSVESCPGQGSTFSILLPGAAADEEAMPQARHEGAVAVASSETHQILYIEDNESNVQLIRRILSRRENFDLVVARNLAEGLSLLAEALPDVILLDLNLPDGSGEAIVRWVRTELQNPSLPIIVLSADCTAGQAERLIATGADFYITKPLDMNSFLHVLDSAILGDAS